MSSKLVAIQVRTQTSHLGSTSTDLLARYYYDTSGQRLRTEYHNPADSSVAEAQHSLYQGLKLLSQYDLAGDKTGISDITLNANYQFSSSGVASLNIGRRAYNEVDPNNNTQTYFHTDALGSVLATSKFDKTIAARYDYDAWGKEINNTGTSNNPLGYTGHQMDRASEDKTGLIYANARYLDPDTGRFLSFDPFEGYDEKPISLHRYLYAYQNPVVYVDPTGKVPVLDETGEFLNSTADELIDMAGETDSTAEAVAYGVGAGANYLIGGVVEVVNFGLNIAGNEGWLGEGVQDRARSELYESFATIQQVVENPKGTANAVVSNAKNTAQAAAAGDTKAIAQVTAGFTAFVGGGGVQGTVNTVKGAGKLAATVPKVAKAGANKVKEVVQQVVENASQPRRGQMFGQRGAVGDLGQTKSVTKRGISDFQGMEVRAQRSLSHVDESTLRAMQEHGFAAKDFKGNKLVLHHHQQNPAGPIIEMPAKNHSIGNPKQHPHGNQKGAGLSKQQRDDFNQWRTDYWKDRATQELGNRGL